MNKGKSIVELAQVLQSQRDHAKDFVIPGGCLGDMTAEVLSVAQAVTAPEPVLAAGRSDKAAVEELLSQMDLPATLSAVEAHERQRNGLGLAFIKDGEKILLQPTSWAHGQISDFAKVPRQYYNRLDLENPDLLALNVNHGFNLQAAAADKNSRLSGRLIRTHGNQLRALVSSKFRRLDNFDLVEAIFPVLIELGFEVESSELTDRRMYLKMVSKKVQAEVKPGDVIQYGLVISNSDVGSGSVLVEMLIKRLVCSNGMIMEGSFRKNHVGRNQGLDEIQQLLSDDTKRKSDEAFFGMVRDVVQSYAKPENFSLAVNKLRAATERNFTSYDLPKIIERAASEVKVGLTEKASGSVLDYLARGADGAGMNAWGLANAFTWAAEHGTTDYETSTELERAGSKIIELTPRQWESVNATK